MMVLTQAYLEWEQQTEQRGEQTGILKGKQEEAQSLVLRQLTRRIGDVPSEMRSQIQALSLNQLEALLDFLHPSDLVNWLQTNESVGL